MSKGIMPKDPSRADHRYIQYQIKNFMKKPVVEDPDEYDHLCRVFARAGGSWERLFKGSVRDIVLLRRIIKLGIKKGFLSKAPSLR
jgi:hypothetical protein